MRRPKRWAVPYADEVVGAKMDYATVRELLRGPLKDLAKDRKGFPADLPLSGMLRYDTRIRTFRKGEVIIRQGDYGDSAYFVLSGKVHVLLAQLPSQSAGSRIGQKASQFFGSIARMFRSNSGFPEVRRKDSRPEAEKALGQIVHLQDFPEFLLEGSISQYDPEFVEEISAGKDQRGETFGEIAALSRTARTATVLAAEDTQLLEIRWQGLRDIRKYSKRWKEMIDERYRSASLLAHLRYAQYTANLSRERVRPLSEEEMASLEHEDERIQGGEEGLISDLTFVARHTRFRSYGEFTWQTTFKEMAQSGGKEVRESEPVIVKQGNIASELILIRSGFVRVTRRYNHGEKTVAYLGKGQSYGMAELFHNAGLEQSDQAGESLAYQHSLRAIGHVDILAIPGPIVTSSVVPHLRPEEKASLNAELEDLQAEEIAASKLGADSHVNMLEFLVEERAINGTAAMLIDLERCTSCDDCVRACARTHDNNPRFMRFGPQQEGVQLTHACMHCVDPVCMIGCPTGAIHRDAIGNQVVINEYTCIGCSTCADNCPYENIQMVEIRDGEGDFMPGTTKNEEKDVVRLNPEEEPIRKATKCDLCENLPSGPACANACPHDALIRVDLTRSGKLFDWMSRS